MAYKFENGIVHNIFPMAVMEFKPPIDTVKLITELETYNSNLRPHSSLDGNATSIYDPACNLLLEPQFNTLKLEIDKCIKEFSTVIGYVDDLMIVNSWFSIMNKGSRLRRHNHKASIISGAYHPKCPDGSVGLTFNNPLEPYKMCELYDKDTEYNANECTFPVREGHLILFPSWLEHETKINTTTNERYVMSFNTQPFRIK